MGVWIGQVFQEYEGAWSGNGVTAVRGWAGWLRGEGRSTSTFVWPKASGCDV